MVSRWRAHERHPGYTPPLYRWRVAGTDYNGNPYDRDEATCEEAHRTAARLNAKGGRIFVTRQRWDGPAVAYRDAPEDSR